jgi:hypothetical protein
MVKENEKTVADDGGHGGRKEKGRGGGNRKEERCFEDESRAFTAGVVWERREREGAAQAGEMRWEAMGLKRDSVRRLT